MSCKWAKAQELLLEATLLPSLSLFASRYSLYPSDLKLSYKYNLWNFKRGHIFKYKVTPNLFFLNLYLCCSEAANMLSTIKAIADLVSSNLSQARGVISASSNFCHKLLVDDFRRNFLLGRIPTSSAFFVTASSVSISRMLSDI